MKACSEFRHDLATAAACTTAFSPETVAHLRDCPACQRAFADLQSAASIQSQTAASLPTPKANPNFHPWLANKISNEKSSRKESTPRAIATFRWRPILAASIALITLLAILAFFTFRNPPEETTLAQTPPSETAAQETPLPQSTLISLRHQISNPTEQIIAENPAASLPHYRLIDAHLLHP